MSKNHKNYEHNKTAKITQQGLKQFLDFLLKLGEQDWFQLLFMCARFESSTVNRAKVIEVWNLFLWTLFVTIQRGVHRLRLSTWMTFVLLIAKHSNLAHMKRLWIPLCSSIFSKIHGIIFSVSFFVSFCVFFWPGGKTDKLIISTAHAVTLCQHIAFQVRLGCQEVMR